ncbi:MAG: CapA family protein [Desulfobaccales bacterium]
MRKQVRLILVLGLALALVGSAPVPEDSASPKAKISLAAVGDIMMGNDFPCPELPPEDGKSLFEEAKAIFTQADIAFGNLEGVLGAGGCPAKDVDSSNVYVFRTPPRFAANLHEAGLKVVSVANNHAMDFGYTGKLSTKRALDDAGIKYSGQDGEVAEFDLKGVQLGVIALAFGPPPRSIIHPKSALREIEALAKKYDILVVSVHWGKEGRSAQHTADKNEYFLGEDRGNLVRFAHEAIDRGADLILGHGPHVPRAMEIYQGKLIAYSLGNFCTYKGMNLVDERGYAPLLWVEMNEKGDFVEGRVHSFIQPRPGGPQKDDHGMAFNRIKTLSLEDFPESCPLFVAPDKILPSQSQDKPHDQ